MKFGTVAFAVMASVSSPASAQLTINAAGSSSIRQTILEVVVGQICNASPTGAPTITIHENGWNVRRMACPTAAYGNLVFNYDNTTGSFLGIGPVSGNGELTARVATGGTCAEQLFPPPMSGKYFRLFTGCSNEGTLVRPHMGAIDVEVGKATFLL